MKYDVIVIGSGLGGLICARQLAKEGWSVLMLERQAQPGGCLQSYRRALSLILVYIMSVDWRKGNRCMRPLSSWD